MASKCCENSLKHYQSDLSTKINEKLYLNEQTANVWFVFECLNGEKTKIAAHKSILAQGSDSFHTMFYGSLKEGDDVKIVDVSPDGLKQFLQFFYLKQINLTMDHITEVMYLANKYLVEQCFGICEKFLLDNLKTEDLCIGYQLSIEHKLPALKAFCVAEINKNTDAVFQSESFKDFSIDVLKSILDFENLSCNGMIMLDALIAWADQKCVNAGLAKSTENRRQQLGDCLYQIQFGLMDLTQINQCMKYYKGLFNAEELEDILTIISAEDETPHLKWFNHKTGISQVRCSTLGPLVECSRRKIGTRNKRFTVYQSEFTTFQSSKKILLCAISFNWCGVHQNEFDITSAPMKIIEKAATGNTPPRTVTILKQQIKFSDVKSHPEHLVDLRKVITVHPNMLYEIQIYFNANQIFSYTSHIYREDVPFNNDCTISFKRNYTLGYDNIIQGIVTGLYFRYAD